MATLSSRTRLLLITVGGILAAVSLGVLLMGMLPNTQTKSERIPLQPTVFVKP